MISYTLSIEKVAFKRSNAAAGWSHATTCSIGNFTRKTDIREERERGREGGRQGGSVVLHTVVPYSRWSQNASKRRAGTFVSIIKRSEEMVMLSSPLFSPTLSCLIIFLTDWRPCSSSRFLGTFPSPPSHTRIRMCCVTMCKAGTGGGLVTAVTLSTTVLWRFSYFFSPSSLSLSLAVTCCTVHVLMTTCGK